MSNEEALNNAGSQPGYHKAGHYWWRRMSLYQSITIIGLLIPLTYMAFKPPPPATVIAATPDGKLFSATVLENPIMSEAALITWVATALTESFTMGHHDWKVRLTQVAEHFTDEGYEQFIEQLEKSKVLPRIRDDFQLLSSIPEGTPVITSTSNFQGKLVVTMEIPYLFTFHRGKGSENLSVIIKVLTMRTTIDERVRGMGIQQIIVEQRSA